MSDLNRPDYITCIRNGDTKRSICGRYLGFDFAFVDMKHALATESSGSRLALCDDCRKTQKGRAEK